MKDFFRDMMMFSLGSANLFREVVEDFADEMIRSGKATVEEKNGIVSDLSKKADQAREDFEKMVSGLVDSMIKEMNLVRRDEYEALFARVEKLERDRDTTKVSE